MYVYIRMYIAIELKDDANEFVNSTSRDLLALQEIYQINTHNPLISSYLLRERTEQNKPWTKRIPLALEEILSAQG